MLRQYLRVRFCNWVILRTPNESSNLQLYSYEFGVCEQSTPNRKFLDHYKMFADINRLRESAEYDVCLGTGVIFSTSTELAIPLSGVCRL